MPTMGKCYTLWKIKWLYLGSLLILIGMLDTIPRFFWHFHNTISKD